MTLDPWGIPIVESPYLDPDTVIVLGDTRVVLRGVSTVPLAVARADARRIVREGMADVIEWLRDNGRQV